MWHIFHASVSIFRCSCACMLSCFSGVRLFVTLWTVACQAPLSIILTLFRDQRSLKPRTLRHTLKLTDKKKKKKKKKNLDLSASCLTVQASDVNEREWRFLEPLQVPSTRLWKGKGLPNTPQVSGLDTVVHVMIYSSPWSCEVVIILFSRWEREDWKSSQGNHTADLVLESRASCP